MLLTIVPSLFVSELMDTSKHLRPSLMSSYSDDSCKVQLVILAKRRQASAQIVDQPVSKYERYLFPTQ